MPNLHFSLKTEWFNMTKSGVKTEDYREITRYWLSRLMTWDGKVQPAIHWTVMAIEMSKGNTYEKAEFKPYDYNVMTLGYPKSDDTERRITLEHKGMSIGTGNPDWGAEPGKRYIIIKHGNIIS